MERKVVAIMAVEDKYNDGRVVDTALYDTNRYCRNKGIYVDDAMAIDYDSESARERYMSYLAVWMFNNSYDEATNSPMSYDEYLKSEEEE